MSEFMNKFILCVMDRENRTYKELEINKAEAYDVAYLAGYEDCSDSYYVAEAAFTASSIRTDYYIDEYFKLTGENRADYEKALEDKG